MYFLSRIAKKKNLDYALKVLAQCQGDIRFDIYGPIEDQNYWSLCQALIKELPANISCRYCGAIAHEDVQDTFAQYDLFFLPTLNENYGHVIVEALLSGCPVLVSDQTPWLDLLKNRAGWHFDLESPHKFIDRISALAEMNNSEYRKLRVSAIKYIERKLADENIIEKYIHLFSQSGKRTLDQTVC